MTQMTDTEFGASLDSKPKQRMISVTGGKGGVGKTFFSINLALQLAKQGFRTCLFDADLGLSNIDVMLGLNPAYTLADLFDQKRSLQEILIKNHEGIDIIPGGSGIEQLAQLPPDAMQYLIRAFSELDQYDFIIFDTAAGISKNVISFCLAGMELIFVITPEPTSITDAYALLKVLTLNGLQAKVMVVFNQIKKVVTAKKAFQLFDETVVKHLHLKIQPLGFVFQDVKIQEALRDRRAFLSAYPDSKAAVCFKQIATNLIKMDQGAPAHVDRESFWKNYLDSVQKKHFIFAPTEKVRTEEENTDFFEVTQDINLSGIPLAPERTDTNDFHDGAAEKHASLPAAAVEQKESRPEIRPRNPVRTDSTGELIQAVKALSDELKQIRKVLESNLGKSMTTFPNQNKGPQPEIIKLDLDAYVEKHGGKA
jgi:MinD-like ATPase involved in chromosome partitioning or flagellar assembly